MKEVVEKDIVSTLEMNNNREDNYMAIMQTMVHFGYYRLGNENKNKIMDRNEGYDDDIGMLLASFRVSKCKIKIIQYML
jgi:hypothetical protein